MKTCFKCGARKPISDFYRHSRMADGHLNKCKDCTRRDTANRVAVKSHDPHWAISERRRHRLKSRSYRASGRAKNPTTAQNRARGFAWVRNHPDKAKAHAAVHRALRSGKLTRQACEKCGRTPAQAHHDDYSKPLVVRWLCATHHAEHHAAEREKQLIQQIK